MTTKLCVCPLPSRETFYTSTLCSLTTAHRWKITLLLLRSLFALKYSGKCVHKKELNTVKMIWVRENITRMVENGRNMINYGQVENKFPNLMYCRTNSAFYNAPQKFKWNFMCYIFFSICCHILPLYPPSSSVTGCAFGNCFVMKRISIFASKWFLWWG